MNRVLTTLAWCYIALCAACEGTEAAPPEGVALDPATVAWFEGLVRSDGLSCCGAGDCKPEHIEVVNGQILRISDSTEAGAVHHVVDGYWTVAA